MKAGMNAFFNGQRSAVACDTSRVGFFRSGFLWVLDKNGSHSFDSQDAVYAFGGVPGDLAVTGDWNGDGTTKVGIYRASQGQWLLDYNGDGHFDPAVDKVYQFGGAPGDVPVAGDWNGDGRTKIGVFRNGFLWILDTDGDGTFGAGDSVFAFGGDPGDIPMVGDWNSDGLSKAGLFRQGFLWVLDTNNSHAVDAGDDIFPFGGIAGDVPVVCDWQGNGRTNPGIFRMGFFWILDTNGNHGIGSAFAFGGVAGDKPVIGKW